MDAVLTDTAWTMHELADEMLGGLPPLHHPLFDPTSPGQDEKRVATTCRIHTLLEAQALPETLQVEAGTTRAPKDLF